MLSPHCPSCAPGTAGVDHTAVRTVPRELDSRSADGVHVRPLWHPDDGHVSVEVHDNKTCETFELHVCDNELALDVFHHPFAYAA